MPGSGQTGAAWTSISLGTTVALKSSLQPIILSASCCLTDLNSWKEISQQDTKVESIFSLWSRLSFLGPAENRFWGPLRVSEAHSSVFVGLGQNFLRSLSPGRIWVDPGEGDASLDNSCLVGGSSLEEVGLCGRLYHPSLLENHLLLERTPALGSGRIARGWGLHTSPLTPQESLCLLIPPWQ